PVNGFDECRVAGQRGDFRVEIAHHADTRRRGSDDDFGSPKDLDEVTDEWNSLALIAGVEVHLPAAGLGLRKVHRMAQTLQQQRSGDTHVGKQRIVEAGNEERNLHRPLLSMISYDGHSTETVRRLTPGA